MAHGVNGRSWPSATIPYEIDSGDFPIGSADRAEVERAITEWNDSTVMRLVPHNDESDFIVFQDTGTTANSQVGRISGQQVINCDLEGGFDAGNLMHEIGHAVGLFHEHQRPDRGSFIQVGDNSDRDCPVRDSTRILTDYDCGSIMHYPTGSDCSISLIAGGCSSIGQRVRLSGRDVWGASLLHDVGIRTVVAWHDDSDGNGFGQIHMSALADNGKHCAGPIAVNTSASGQHLRPEVGMSGDRNMIFVWEDDTDNNKVFQIKMRGFRSNGRQLFSQRTVNTISAGQQLRPHVSVARDGRFVVVWQDDSDGNGSFQIRVRGFNANGTERFSERTVNTVATGTQTNPRVAIAPDGYFVVVYEDDCNKNGIADVRMRAFNHDGSERWSDRRASTGRTGDQRKPRIAMGPFGDFAVVWEDDTDGNKFYQIHMRGFDSNGNQKIAQRTVNNRAAGQQFNADVAVDDVSRPVVVWSDDRDRNTFFQIRMRGFESNGSERISERTVNTDADGQQERPRICMEANGRFVVAWEDDKDNDRLFNVLYRGFNADGSQRFTTRQVSNIPGGTKVLPCIATQAMDSWDVFNPF
jgi:hypothetical protein